MQFLKDILSKFNSKYVITVVISFATIFVVSIVGYFFYLDRSQQKIIFTNESSQIVKSVEIKFADQTINLENINPNISITKGITVTKDADFDIKIVFSDGLIITESNIGYITNLDGSDNIFIVTKDKQLIFSQEY